MAEFIALLKAHPKDYNFASSGAGSSIHLSGELFKQMAGVEMVHVPYKGSAPAVADLLAGHVKVMFDNLASSWPYVKQGSLRALGVTGAKPDPLAPGVPAIAETLPGYDATSWAGLLAPAKTPPAIVDEDFGSGSTRDPDARCRREVQSDGRDAGRRHARAFRQVLKDDIEKWRAVVEKAGVKIE